MRDGLKDFGFLLLYAIAAVSGGMGGCATALHILKRSHSNKKSALALVCAYVVLGIVFGVLTLAGLYVLERPPSTVHHLILEAAFGGSCGSVALAFVNWSAKLVFEKFGVKVQVTLRHDDDERRLIEE